MRANQLITITVFATLHCVYLVFMFWLFKGGNSTLLTKVTREIIGNSPFFVPLIINVLHLLIAIRFELKSIYWGIIISFIIGYSLSILLIDVDNKLTGIVMFFLINFFSLIPVLLIDYYIMKYKKKKNVTSTEVIDQ